MAACSTTANPPEAAPVETTNMSSAPAITAGATTTPTAPARRASSSIVVLRSDGEVVEWRDGVVTIRAVIPPEEGWNPVLRGTLGRITVHQAGRQRSWDTATWAEATATTRELAPTADGYWDAVDDARTAFQRHAPDGTPQGLPRQAGETVLIDAAVASADPVAVTRTRVEGHTLLLAADGPLDLGEGRPVATSARHVVIEGSSVRVVDLATRTSTAIDLPARSWPASSDVVGAAFSPDGRRVALLVGTTAVAPWRTRAVLVADVDDGPGATTVPAPDGATAIGWLGDRLVVSSLGTTTIVDQQPQIDSTTGYVVLLDPVTGRTEPVPGLTGGGQVVVA